jgi:hypothetical protein
MKEKRSVDLTILKHATNVSIQQMSTAFYTALFPFQNSEANTQNSTGTLFSFSYSAVFTHYT